MNHEKRITKNEQLIDSLFKEIEKLSSELSILKDNKKAKFIRLSELQKNHYISPWIVKKMIKDGKLIHGVDFRRSGRLYLFNLDSIHKVI